MTAQDLKRTAAVALAYALVGAIALQLAVPPDYASPVYPSAGIALAAAIVYGWPGVAGAAVGSFVANAGVRLIDSTLTGVELAIPLATAGGAALQAWAGAALVRRFLAQPLRLENTAETVRFALLAGPAGCLVSASVATAAFWLAQTVPTEALGFTWWTWWIGDTTGVLIAAPIVLAFIAEPRSIWAPRQRVVAMPLAVATLIVGLGIAQVGRWESERLDSLFRQAATALAGDMNESLSGHLNALQAIHDVFEATEDMNGRKFEHAAEHWLRNLPSLQALGWSAFVAAGEQADFVQRMQAEIPGFRLFDRTSDGSRPAPPDGADVIAITYIEPRAGNETALGLNSLSAPAAADALARALKMDRPQATSGFRLTQETAEQTGVVVYAPVWRLGNGRMLQGVAFATMRMDDVVRNVARTTADGLASCLFDVSADAAFALLAGGDACRGASAASARALTNRIDFAGRQWALQTRATNAFARARRDWAAWWFSVSAMAATGLLGAFLLVGSGRAHRIGELVDERTTALRHEIDERQAKEQELLAAEQRFRDVFDAASVGLAYTDLQGRFVRVNARFCAICGYSASELEQRNADDIRAAEDAAMRAHVLEILSSGERSRLRTQENFVRPNGRRIPVAVTHSLSRDTEGRPLYLVMVVDDLRERLAREAAEAANRAKTEFLSRMSHELRTPLNAMLGFAQVLQLDNSSPLTPAQRERVEHIQKAGWHLLEMINDVLELSRIESGALRVSLEPLDLARLLGECASMHDELLRKLDVHLETDVADDARYVTADATRLRQVVANLLSNAIKYNRRGGRVTLRSERGAGGTVVLHVIDTGVGLSAGQIGLLFQPFNRLGREHGEVEGTGIGLVITRSLVKLMNGRLKVTSTPGEGSTFSVVLQAAATAPVTRIDASPARIGGVASTRRVIYIEDNDVNIEVVRGMLQLAGPIEFEAYERGIEGLHGVLARPPDLLLLDLNLPDVSGLDILRQLRAEETTRSLPIVIVSADALNEQVSEGVAAGADAYLTKPIQLEPFLQLVDRLLGSVQA